MNEQITDTILMVRPVAFYKNEETAVNNYFQDEIPGASLQQIQTDAVTEFDRFVDLLRVQGVEVIVVEDIKERNTPDSIFPNNWVSFHVDGTVMTYPMYAENRRRERRQDIIDLLAQSRSITRKISFTDWEAQGKYLEGTGSLILDRVNHIAFAAVSERTNVTVLADFEQKSGYRVVKFGAYQTVENQRLPIYHTNVLMAIGDGFAVLCAECIDNEQEREEVISELAKSGKEIVYITESQVHQFAGNVLQVKSSNGQKFIVMSGAAFQAFTDSQKKQMEKYGKLLYSPIPTIEKLGGGSVRCMMAEVFLPRK